MMVCNNTIVTKHLIFLTQIINKEQDYFAIVILGRNMKP